MNDLEYPVWVWTIFFAMVLVALFVDVGIVNRKAHVPSRGETIIWSIIWVSLALAFNGFVYWQVGSHNHDWNLAAVKAKEFLTGYLIELSLSIDNLFVFLLIFNFFKVPKKYRHRALFWGIFMALALRLAMILAGAELVERFEWILYFFGAFLVYTGIKMFFSNDQAFNPEESSIIRLTTKIVPISKTYEGNSFFVIINGKRMGTLLLLVLIIINLADIVFAVDSIPAIFGITTDRFIVYTSNIFAILGLRTFFFLLSELADRFHLLKYGLAFVLSFIGIKMLLPILAQGTIMLTAVNDSAFGETLRKYLNHDYEQFLINISLVTVVAALLLSVIFSMIFPSQEKPENDES